MRKPFIAGNWKMHKTYDEAYNFAVEIRDPLDALEGIDIAFCVPFISISCVAEAVKGTQIAVGAQNMHYEVQGAFTGEISPLMLKQFCQYVILGHSERRQFFGESDEGVNKKVKAALAHGLTPILCVGETLEQNEEGETHHIVSGQVAVDLAGLSAEQVAKCVIAYEPIWAIGTGKSATKEQANQIIGTSVRGVIEQLYGRETAEAIRIQYGGSVNPKNIAEYMQMEHIDGALVGGASLKPDFVELVKSAIV